MDSGFERAGYQYYCICRQRDGILVGSQLYRINVANATEVNKSGDHLVG